MIVVIWRFAPNEWWNPFAWWDLRHYARWRKEVYGGVPSLKETWRYLRAAQKVNIY